MKISKDYMLQEIATMSLLYNMRYSPAEITLMADVWICDLAEEEQEDVKRAIDMHRKTSSTFPTVAHIFELLPQCRRWDGRNNGFTALEEQIPAPANEWASKARDIRAALRGDEEAKKRLEALTRTACGGVMQ